ncbi:S8 family peptidase [Dongia sedimenti]|uniref:S8 family peptidase n=1 Tax=Dongia sedimenti TaxID=3064282 RepID=A0ABU0YR06_9PROT|nr:S8 family peptidase [Rhodospirillaceae bacterium R-7]
MAEGDFPLLVFAEPVAATKSNLSGGPTRIHFPPIGRQRARIAPQLAALSDAFEAKRLRLQQEAPIENPELVLVLEIAGDVQNFAKAVRRVPDLDWLVEWAEDNVAPDDDFYDEDDINKAFSGRLFLLGSNAEALNQLLNLWNRYEANPDLKFDRGYAPFKHVFAQLKKIRPWGVADRIGLDMRAYWQEQVDFGSPQIRFEIEAWYFGSVAKEGASRDEIRALVARLNGRVIGETIIDEIAYHGLLVELTSDAIGQILAGNYPELVLSDRIMFFRPRAQSIAGGGEEGGAVVPLPAPPVQAGLPVVALLDGLPMANHALLAGRLSIDDPDGWSADYEAKDRVHGTAMASLILHGELDENSTPFNRALYVRPVLRPNPADVMNPRRVETSPDDTLLIDLIHRAVKRIFDGDQGEAPAAPSVRVINLSIGDLNRVFMGQLSPWARLLDWLSYEFSVLFVVSAGNDASALALNSPRDGFAALSIANKRALALTELLRNEIERRLLSPAEAINVITVGSLHSDSSTFNPVGDRFDLFNTGSISPISRIGPGYKRSVKPEILMSGGRMLHRQRLGGEADQSILEIANSVLAPGHRVAGPPLQGGAFNESFYRRGTSNATALASRAAAQIYDVLENLRADHGAELPAIYDAVLIKALLTHGAVWGDELPPKLLAERPQFAEIQNGNTRRTREKDFLTRWLGYGAVDYQRGVTCTPERATLLGVGELRKDEALVFSAPLPPSLAGKVIWRRVIVTLAWMSPINSANQNYRRAKLWITPPQEQLRVRRTDVHEKAPLRGTVQHEILEGEDALAFVDGARFECKVNCKDDAGLNGDHVIRFALCVSLEVAVGAEVSVYEEVRDRIIPPVDIRPPG